MQNLLANKSQKQKQPKKKKTNTFSNCIGELFFSSPVTFAVVSSSTLSSVDFLTLSANALLILIRWEYIQTKHIENP